MKTLKILLALTLCLVFAKAFAWQHEIAVGYGFGKEVEQDYHNNGFVLTGKLYKFCPVDDRLIATIDGSISHWHSDTSHDNQTTTIALAPAFRAYFVKPECYKFHPYLGVSFGPTYLTNKQLGERAQGSHFAFQSTIEAGTEMALKNNHNLDFNIHMAHYCNAGLARPNQGFDILYIFTIGYQF